MPRLLDRQYADIIEALNNEPISTIVSITDTKSKQYSHFETISRILFLKSSDGIESALALAIENLVNTFGEDTVKSAIKDNLGDYNDKT